MINHIIIENYRNISEFECKLNNSLNYIVAPNASGKTNFLESIYYSIFGSSFRTLGAPSELIGENNNYAKVITTWDKDELTLVVSKTEETIKRKFSLNNKSAVIKKLPSLFGVILFAPHSVDLTSKEPSIRRKDLDSFLSITFSDYFNNLARYNALHRNRNAVLRQISEGKADITELKYWTEELVKEASKIYYFRYKFFNEIGEFLNIIAKDIFRDFENFELKYLPNLDEDPENFEQKLLEKFNLNIEKERIVGKTLYGIHKDDFSMIFNNKDLRYYGSRGQQRLGSFIYKLAQLRYYEKIKGKSPILLIDDIMSELDEKHREKLSNILLNEKSQIIMTGAINHDIPEFLLKKGKPLYLNP